MIEIVIVAVAVLVAAGIFAGILNWVKASDAEADEILAEDARKGNAYATEAEPPGKQSYAPGGVGAYDASTSYSSSDKAVK